MTSIMETLSLPPEIPLKYREITDAINAYNVCLNLEKSLQEKAGDGEDVEKNLVYCRVLGYLIRHASRDEVVASVASDIVSCQNDRAILDLGKTLCDRFIAAFRPNVKVTTPRSPYQPPLGHFNTKAEMIDAMIQEPSQWKKQKNQAMIRDDFRCVITSLIDFYAGIRNQELKEAVHAHAAKFPPGTELISSAPTKRTNIIPERINSEILASSDKNLCHILKQFGYTTLAEDLKGSKVHRLENVLTLRLELYADFNRWDVWFVSTEKPNTYKLSATHPCLLISLPEYVTFTTPDEKEYPVPKREYLELHAMCVEVAHLSGAFEYLESTVWSLDESPVSTPEIFESELSDGSSPDPIEVFKNS